MGSSLVQPSAIWHTLDELDYQSHYPQPTSYTSEHSADKMSFLLFAVTALHVLILILLFVATLDKSWWVLPDNETVNIWYDCLLDNSTKTWVCHTVSESAISVFVAAVIYTTQVDVFQQGRLPGGSFGYCFVLAWLSFPLALISGIIYIHLRKKE
ncbi:Epithelial membrane protein 3 [Varanus komodoensis]|nr:Epithelial membrane protein 3 [Varanus komodoensis]